jgi:hypothetical protein
MIRLIVYTARLDDANSQASRAANKKPAGFSRRVSRDRSCERGD